MPRSSQSPETPAPVPISTPTGRRAARPGSAAPRRRRARPATQPSSAGPGAGVASSVVLGDEVLRVGAAGGGPGECCVVGVHGRRLATCPVPRSRYRATGIRHRFSRFRRNPGTARLVLTPRVWHRSRSGRRVAAPAPGGHHGSQDCVRHPPGCSSGSGRRRSAWCDDPATAPGPRCPRRPAAPVDVAPPAPYAAPPGRTSCATHGDRVYRLAYRLTGNRHDAEDLTQEVFVRVFRSLSHVHAGHVRGLAAPDHDQPVPRQVRRKARIRFDALPDDAGRPARRAASPARRRCTTTRTSTTDVQAALDALPPEFRAAVVLCDIEGLTYEEIADDAGRQARHRPQPHPPGPVTAADRARAPRSRTGTATRMPEPLAPTGPLR